MKVYVVTETIYDNGNAAYDVLGVYRDKDRAIILTKLLMQVLDIAPYQQKDDANTVTFIAEKNVFTVKEVVVD